jgi:hypothetical protein
MKFLEFARAHTVDLLRVEPVDTKIKSPSENRISEIEKEHTQIPQYVFEEWR